MQVFEGEQKHRKQQVFEDGKNPFYVFDQQRYVQTTNSEIGSEFDAIKSNFNCDYTFPIDLAPNQVPFSAESIGKW